MLVGGGLGPTLDDVTATASRALGRELFEPGGAGGGALWFDRRGVAMSDTNRRQALFPVGARILRNRAGTAPAFLVEEDGRAVVALPGPPRELAVVWQEEVLPWLGAARLDEGAARRAPLLPLRHPRGVFAERAGEWMARTRIRAWAARCATAR